jgi:hypothetical protein
MTIQVVGTPALPHPEVLDTTSYGATRVWSRPRRPLTVPTSAP